MIPIALIEDDPEYREGVARLLISSGRFEVVGTFGSAEEALGGLPQRGARLALVDVNLPGLPGPAAVFRLRESCPELRCVMLTMFDDTETLFSALQAGAVGYLLKTSPQDILPALDEVLAGGAPMSRPIARRVLASFARPVAPPVPGVELTAREREIMDQLCQGLPDKEIAMNLGISTATVKNHLYHVYEKLAVRGRTEAVLKWMKR